VEAAGAGERLRGPSERVWAAIALESRSGKARGTAAPRGSAAPPAEPGRPAPRA